MLDEDRALPVEAPQVEVDRVAVVADLDEAELPASRFGTLAVGATLERAGTIERSGVIALQIHGGMRAVIAYTDIELRALDPADERAPRR